MKKKNKSLALILVPILIYSCTNYSFINNTSANIVRPVGWTEITHSNSVAPDYNIVFPQNKVNRLDITISASDWKLMQDNMKELFGDPQNRTNRGGPGGNPPQGFNPPVPGATPVPGTFPIVQPVPGAIPPNMPQGFNPPAGGEGGMLDFAEDDPVFRPCTVKFDGNTWSNVGIRYKGNSSLKSSWGNTFKLPFKLDFDEFEKEYPDTKNQRFWGFKRLSFSSGFSDNSLIREKVAADIFREAGVPAAKTAFYRIYIDYGEGSKYFGLYTMVEVPDYPMLQTQFKKSEGNLYKPAGTGAKFVTFDEKSFPKKTNEETSDWNDIKLVFTTLNASRDNKEQWRAELEKVFDVKGFLRFLAVNTVIQNWDSYGSMAHNYYLYTDPGDNLVHWIPWDHNMALSDSRGGVNMPANPNGNFQPPNIINPQPSASVNPKPNISPMPSVTPDPSKQRQQMPDGPGMGRGNTTLGLATVDKSWPLIRFLMDDPVYYAQYVSFVDETIKGAFSTELNKQRYQKEHDLIKQYVIGSEGEQKGYTLLESTTVFDNSISELIKHLEGRNQEAITFVQENKK